MPIGNTPGTLLVPAPSSSKKHNAPGLSWFAESPCHDYGMTAAYCSLSFYAHVNYHNTGFVKSQIKYATVFEFCPLGLKINATVCKIKQFLRFCEEKSGFYFLAGFSFIEPSASFLLSAFSGSSGFSLAAFSISAARILKRFAVEILVPLVKV